MRALLLCILAVPRRPLEPLGAQAHVDFVFCLCAVSRDFPEEAAGVAFVEGGDDVGAVWEGEGWWISCGFLCFLLGGVGEKWRLCERGVKGWWV